MAKNPLRRNADGKQERFPTRQEPKRRYQAKGYAAGGSGVVPPPISPTSFLALTDTPGDYIGSALFKVRVNATENGLEFAPDTGSLMNYTYSVNVLPPPPAGEVYFDNADPLLATQCHVNYFNNAGLDVSSVLATYLVDDVLAIQSDTATFLYLITGVTDNVAFYTYDVTLQSSVNTLTDRDNVTITDASTGSGVGSWLDLTDTPLDYVDQYGRIPVVNIAEDALQFINYNKEPMYSGIETGGILTINGTTNVDVTGGTGRIIDSTTQVQEEQITRITWTPQTIAITSADLFDVIVIAVDNAGVIQQYPSLSTQVQRDNVVLGLVYWFNGAITLVQNINHFLSQASTMMLDYVDFLSNEDKARGLAVRPVTAQLQVWRASGKLFQPFSRWTTDVKEPHNLPIGSDGSDTVPTNLAKILENGTVLTTDPVIPLSWDSAGIVTGLVGTEATIHYMFMDLAGNNHLLQLGQTAYPDFATALNQSVLDNENFRFIANAEKLLLLAQIVVDATATNFDNPDVAIILNDITAGGAGGGTVTNDFIGLTDTPGTYVGSDGLTLRVNETLNGVFFLGVGGALGLATTLTVPSTNVVYGDFYVCDENGNYPNFGLGAVTIGQELFYNGATWIVRTPGSSGAAQINDWLSGNAYALGDFVRYQPTQTLYRCEVPHTSTLDFVADLGNNWWSHLTGYINTAREFQGGLIQQTAYEQVLYMRDNTTPRTPITVTTPGYRDTLVPVAQTPPMTVESTWTLTSNPLLATASLCDPAKSERRHVSFAGTYFTVGDFIAFGPSISGPFGDTRWEILRVGRTSGDNYHYAEVSPDNCNVPCQQSPSAGAFQTYRPSGADYIDPLAVTAVTDIGGGEWQIDLDDAHDGTGTAILDDTWGVGQAILQFDVDDPDTYFVIKSIPSNTSVICEPSAALPTTLISNPAGWLPTVGMNLRTSGVAAPLARITPTVTAVDDNLDGSYNIVFDTNIDISGLNWTVGHAIVPLSDTSGNTYAALDSFFGANAFRMFPDVSFPQFYLPTVGIQMDTSGTAAQPLPTLGEDPRVPALDGEIANKKYVDDEITKVTGPILGTNGGIAIASAYASSNASFNIPEGPTVSTWTTVNLTIAERYRGQTVNVFANAFMTARSAGFAASDTPILVVWYTNSSLRKRDRILPQAANGTTNTILQIPPHIDNFTIPTGSGDYTLRIDIGFWKENAGRTVTVGNSEGVMRLGAQAYLASGLPIIYLDDLTDVSAGSPAVGDGLIWNGSNYIVSKPTVNPRFLTPVQNQALGSSHVRIATWGRNTAEIPTGQWCEITIDIVGTFSTTATMNFWLRPSSATGSLYRGSFTPRTDPTTGSVTGNIHGKLVVQAPGSSLDIQLRIDGGTGTLRYDNTHGYSRITVQPIYL